MWLISLRHKLDFFDAFKQLHSYIQCQFDAKIYIFLSDEGSEFANSAFEQYIHQHGIHHQYSCPKTLEKNSIVECMHHSITEL